MTVDQQLSVAATTDEARAIATLTTAFSNDPVTRWVLPDADKYLHYWPKVVQAFGGRAFGGGTAHAVADHGGIALWLGPGIGSDEETMGSLLDEAVDGVARDDVFAFMSQMDEWHPTDTHWYLPLMGVDLPNQGRGYGSALLRHALQRLDEDRLPAYLEASSPQNKRLYERHGFDVIGVIQAGGSPPMWPMLRPTSS